MRTTHKERIAVLTRLVEGLNISLPDAEALRRISMTLQRWFELECGDGNGCIARDEQTGKAYWLSANSRFVDPKDPRTRTVIPDRESGAKKRLAKIMAQYPELVPYVQTDPRGCALYVLRKSELNGCDIEQVYTRGVAVY